MNAMHGYFTSWSSTFGMWALQACQNYVTELI